MLQLVVVLLVLSLISAKAHTFSIYLKQEAFHVSPHSGPSAVITPELSSYVERLLKESEAPGLSLGVVHFSGGDVGTEFGQWGVKNEDGDKVTEEVCARSSAFAAADEILHSHRHSLLLAHAQKLLSPLHLVS